MTALKQRAAADFDGDIVLCPDNETCIDGADVIATCTNGDDVHDHSARVVQAGAFAVGIEGGCAYTAEALHARRQVHRR